MLAAEKISDHGKGLQVRQMMRPIQPHLDRKDVTEITINRPGEIWAKTFGGWEQIEVPELSMAYLEMLSTVMIAFNQMQVRSICSVQLPDGERGQIVKAPAVVNGTVSISIRKHASVTKTLEQLDDEGAFEDYADVSFHRPSEATVAAELVRTDARRLSLFEAELLGLLREGKMREFLHSCVLNKRNLVIAGKTNSGKTTFARSLIEKVPTTERLVTIEDVHELFLPNHPNRVHMLYGQSQGRVSADECLASCMRQSPDRIFLAELRGDEAWEYVNSLNTGHPGSITTTHANGALQTFERIATLIKKSPVGLQLDMDMIKQVLTGTIDVVLYFHERKLKEIFYDPIYARSRLG